MGEKFRIGMICGKLGDTDGVSLEADKWNHMLGELEHEVFTIAGKYPNRLENVKPENQITLPSLSLDSDEQKEYERAFFPNLLYGNSREVDSSTVRRNVEKLKDRGMELRNQIYSEIKNHDIDVIIPNNTNAMPMTLEGAMASFYLTGRDMVAGVFHNHDFRWERTRFVDSNIEDLLEDIMPPRNPGIQHVVLSRYAQHNLMTQKGVHDAIIIPNCEDFDNPPMMDDYTRNFRSDFDFANDNVLIVQPTRIIRRKNIEDSIDLISKFTNKYPEFKDKVRFMISLYEGDEPDRTYKKEITHLAERKDIPVYFLGDEGRVASVRKIDGDGKRVYTPRDVLVNADLVTYLPYWEGFGNAFLEATAARKPIVMAAYLVYDTDIATKGFDHLVLRRDTNNGHSLLVGEDNLEKIYEVLTDPVRRADMVNRNFEVGRQNFGFDTLRKKLQYTFEERAYNEIIASRGRIRRSKVKFSI